MSEEGRLIVVSNRLPLTIRRLKDGWRAEHSSGGLATAMNPILKRTGGIWVGWPGEAPETPDAERQRLLDEWAEREGYVTTDLPQETASRYYEGYSNQTLWPLFHHFPMYVKYDPLDWLAYTEANQRFCETVIKHARPHDLIWVHDYQLMLLPRLIREAMPEARIGFFLHIPFPSSEVFRLLPRREELLNGLLGADLLAFHTYNYLEQFRASLLRILGFDSRMDGVETDGRTVRLRALPIGIAPEEFQPRLDDDGDVAHRLSRLRQRYKGQRILLGVDRLDYTKGIPERLRTFQRLLKRAPDLRGRVVLIQVAVPSRERVPTYHDLRREVNELVGEINGDFETSDWTPVVYIRRGIPRSELIALYSAAEVCWVTPLRDGMNLVAKEYVACKRGEDGVLLLSEFAGAAAEMGEAFLVNPYDEEQTAEVLERALALSQEERHERMAALYRRVVRNNVFAWGEEFLSDLSEASQSRLDRPTGYPLNLPITEIVNAFSRQERRLLLLDYDGTLAPYAKRPQDAVPTSGLLELLAELADNPDNCVAVVSGRSRAVLEAWFGETKGLWLAAEHGAVMRSPVSMNWELYRPTHALDWKQQVYPVLEHFVDRTPGSFIEEKEFSFVWHYRMTETEFGEWLANELVADLEQMLADTELRAVRGQKSVEVKLLWANKGEVLARLEDAFPSPTFLFAAGDDRTDEDLFERLPEEAWTVHIGVNRSRARFRLPNPRAMHKLLAAFAEADRLRRKQTALTQRA
jgi:trehalose 6-phosphate synthase/phosphatase